MNETPEIDPKHFSEVLKQIGESADARTVFGDPVISGDRAVIPVARVRHSGGGGMGGAGGGHECTSDCPPECEDALAELGYGSGMGLGYSIAAEPVGVIEVTADDVYWLPTLDVNRLAIIGAMAGAAVAVLVALRRVLRS